MPDYLVTWSIDIFDAEHAQDAARKALAIQRDPASIATVFDVRDRNHPQRPFTIDLEEEEDEAISHDPPCADCGNLEHHTARY